MKSSVIVFPGSNCDRDIAVALEKLQFTNSMVWHKETELPKSDLIVVPGGFSYGDYLRSGAIAAKSNILTEVIDAAKENCIAFKPNISFFEAYGIEGLKILHTVREKIPSHIPMIIDAKRGDNRIASCLPGHFPSENQAIHIFIKQFLLLGIRGIANVM